MRLLLKKGYRSDFRLALPTAWKDVYNGRLKLEMIRERGPFCARCNKWKEVHELTVDHIYPKWMGYNKYDYLAPDNRNLVCRKCHVIKQIVEHSFGNRINSRKNTYLLLGDY